MSTPDAYGDGLSRLQRITWVIARGLVVGIAKVWFRAELHNAENLPTSGAFIVAPVHRSNLDTPILPFIRKAPIRFMGKASLWETNKAADWLLTMLGGFPVARGAADRGALRAAEEILARGETLVMFPEGTRRSGDLVLEENMFDGPSFVAGRQQCPVVPIGIGGSERAMPIGSKFIFPRKIVFVIGEPMDPPAQNDNGRVSRNEVKRHTESLRLVMQDLYDEAMELVG
jgi:1-acyl-sn-glycerol-3-phosphate acyltransferase